MNDILAEAHQGLLEWSDPIILDRLVQVYYERLRRTERARELAHLHGKVWRALLAADYRAFEQERQALLTALDRHGLTLDSFAAVDSEILVELLQIVVARFQRSHRVAMGYHLALIEVARHMSRPQAA